MLGFHAQQAVEKSLKAVLASREIEFPRTQDLTLLFSLAERHGVAAPRDLAEADALTPWAVEFRYEESLGKPLDRDAALHLVERVEAWATEVVETAPPSG
ncbi:MAG TPA: HEPN domain-containing protein [Acidimicrobiales bacterium]|nr:HEPN domain-containing protein [Acidimicrobiales bacterium]